MGGRISVESEEGRGSVFAFTAEFGAAPGAPPMDASARRDLKGMRVLVVDDNATNRLILDEWLRGWDAEPTAVADGLSALSAMWQAVSLGRPFAVVLLDHRMPGIDGMMLTAEIRRSSPLSACPIILLTSEDRPADRAHQRELGIAAIATKPIAEEELFTTIFRVLAAQESGVKSQQPGDRGQEPKTGRKEQESGVKSQESGDRGQESETRRQESEIVANTLTPDSCPLTPGSRPSRILVAEDNELNQQVVLHLLARQGHTVEIAADGITALAKLAEGGFDLLLLDVHMPELDGFQVIRTLRQNEQGTGQRLPVVALTARSMKGDRERCLEAGMDDFLGKPIRRAELFAAVEHVLAGRSQESGARNQEPGISGQHMAPDSRLLTPDDLLLLDAATLLTACDGDAGLLAKMVAIFRTSAPGQMERVAAAVRDGDAASVREAAHRLRGLVSAFSPIAAEAARQLEQAGADCRLDGADTVCASLAGLLGELTGLLDKLTVEELRSGTGLNPGPWPK